MKKNYMKPTMNVVNMQIVKMICGSDVSKVSGNAGLNYGGGSTTEAQSRRGGWDDEED